MRRHAVGILLTALAIISASAVSAQEAVPETPPELRDFRLDQPNPQPNPQAGPAPATTQPVSPPPAVRTVPQPAPEQSVPTPQEPAPPPRRETRQISPAAPVSDNNEASVTPPLLETRADQAQPQVQSPEPDSPASTESMQTDQDAWSVAMLAIVAGGASLLAVAAFMWWRRRRTRHVPKASHMARDDIPASPVVPRPAVPVVGPTPSATLPQRQKDLSPNVSVEFIPEKATISFTMLTVKGQLQIFNGGHAVANKMQLRTVLLSASHEQEQAIDSFFADPDQVEPTALGDAKPGERLGLALELSVPLNEMQSFPLKERRLLVPIMIATLSYSDEKQVRHEARLACMIGREAQPPKPKMGPLRLDKGPRSFAPLGQRPIYT